MAESAEAEEVICDHLYIQNMNHDKSGVVMVCKKCGKQLRVEEE